MCAPPQKIETKIRYGHSLLRPEGCVRQFRDLFGGGGGEKPAYRIHSVRVWFLGFNPPESAKEYCMCGSEIDEANGWCGSRNHGTVLAWDYYMVPNLGIRLWRSFKEIIRNG